MPTPPPPPPQIYTVTFLMSFFRYLSQVQVLDNLLENNLFFSSSSQQLVKQRHMKK